ncbi:MAG: hypothetical protein ABEI78_00270 [Candidatus Nanohaloarchaea archaeon]
MLGGLSELEIVEKEREGRKFIYSVEVEQIVALWRVKWKKIQEDAGLGEIHGMSVQEAFDALEKEDVFEGKDQENISLRGLIFARYHNLLEKYVPRYLDNVESSSINKMLKEDFIYSLGLLRSEESENYISDPVIRIWSDFMVRAYFISESESEVVDLMAEAIEGLD